MRPVAKHSVSVRPSHFLKCLVRLVYIASACIVFSTTMPGLAQGALLLLIGVSWLKQNGAISPTGLILYGDGRIEKVLSPLLDGAGDASNDMVLHPHTTVLPFLVVLLYRQKNRLQSLVLLKDSLEAEDFRQLRLWLRWHTKKLT